MDRLCKTVKGHKVEVVGRLVIRYKNTNAASRSAFKTRHSFDFKVELPQEVKEACLPMFIKVVKELECETRTPAEWARRIKQHVKGEKMQTWAASVAWWDYASDKEGDELVNLCQPLPRFYDGDEDELLNALKALGFPDPTDRISQLLGETKRKVNAALAKLKPFKVRLK